MRMSAAQMIEAESDATTARKEMKKLRTTLRPLEDALDDKIEAFEKKERAKWESEQGSLTRTMPGQPTYMVATLVVLLKKGSSLPDISGVADMRSAISQLAADVAVDGNLLGAEVLWTPEDPNDVMDRDDLFLNFPALVSI